MLDTRQHLDAVIDDEDLSVTRHLQIDRLFDHVLVVDGDHLRLYGVSVRRRSRHDTQIAGSQEGELQGTWDRSCRQRQYIHVRSKTLQFLFGCDAELLFLVDDEQTEVMPFDALADEFMGADEDVYLTRLQVCQDLFHLLRALQTAQVLDPHRHVLHSLAEGVVVLQGQDGGRYQDGYLFAVCRYLERCPHRYFGLTESYVTAHQSIHRHRALKVVLNVRGSLRLIRRVLV